MAIPIQRVKKIVLVRPDAIGDMVLMIPVMKALKKKYPLAHISILASNYNARIIRHLNCFDDIILSNDLQNMTSFWDRVRFLKKCRFDVAVHFGTRDYLVWACFFSVPYNIGDKAILKFWPAFRKAGVFYRNHNRPIHVAEYNFIMLKHLGLSLNDVEPLTISAPENTIDWATQTLKELGRREDKPLIGIQVGVGYGNRPIKPEKYANYINKLQKELDVDVCISGYSDDERKACAIIEENTSKKPLTILGASIENLMGLITHFDVFVSVDTGPFHLGAALGVPQLAIFPSKKVKPLSWGPFRNKHFVVRNNYNCLYDCPHQGCPYDICSDDILESDMIDKTIRLLNGEGYSERSEQVAHWFDRCMNILVLYDDDTKDKATAFHAQLQAWGLFSLLYPVADPNLGQVLRTRDIAIIQNVSKKRRWSLFWMGQKVNRYIYHSPLLCHDGVDVSDKDDLIAYYCKQFGKKVL